MARKIEALVLRNICTESEGIIRKGGTAQLTGEEMEHYIRIGAVQRPAFVAADLDDEPKEVKQYKDFKTNKGVFS